MLFTLKSAGYCMTEYDNILSGKFNYERNNELYFKRDSYATIQLNSLEEFVELKSLIEYDLIVRPDNVIVIYDDYLE